MVFLLYINRTGYVLAVSSKKIVILIPLQLNHVTYILIFFDSDSKNKRTAESQIFILSYQTTKRIFYMTL